MLVRDSEVHDEVDRTHGVGKISRQLNVSTPMTPTPDHQGCQDLGGCVEGVSELLADLFHTTTKVEAGKAAIAGICAPTAQQGTCAGRASCSMM